MKIYTGSGDKGMTSLFSGERVSKSNIRIEANGDLDELISMFGALTAALNGKHAELQAELRDIQSHLLGMGTWIAAGPDSAGVVSEYAIGSDMVKMLESAIDRIDSKLPVLTGFIIPGGHMAASWAHIARAVCRRAERKAVRLWEKSVGESEDEKLQAVIVYLNRLSDYLFVMARFLNQSLNIPDILWQRNDPPSPSNNRR